MKKNVDKMIDVTCEVWGVEREDILKDKRKDRLVFARTTIAYSLFNVFKMSYSEIARSLNRSHASIINMIATYNAQYAYNKEFRNFANRVNFIANEISLDFKTAFQREIEEEFNEFLG